MPWGTPSQVRAGVIPGGSRRSPVGTIITIPNRLSAPTRRAGVLLADAPVNALAGQADVPIVAGVLLPHVHQQLAQQDRFTLGVAAGEAHVVIGGEPLR